MAFVSETSPLVPVWRKAQALVASGDLTGARAVLEHGVELGKVNLSEDDPGVLRTAFELGAVLQRGDDPVAARRVLEEAYAAGQWRLGDADPLMVWISHDIGVVAEELGNRHEARKAFLRVAEFGPAALGGEHRAVVRARAYLGADQSGVRQEAAAPTLKTDGSGGGVASETPSAVRPLAAGQRWGESATPANPAVRVYPAAPTSPPLQVNPVAPADSGSSGRRGPLEEATVVQPIVVPRVGTRGDGVHVPAQRSGGHTAYPGGRSGPDGRRGLGIFAAVAAGLAAVIAVAALVFVLANRSGDSGGGSDVPTLAGAAPSDVKLSDKGSAIGLSWQDPADATVSFMVIMGRPGVELKPVGTLGPGQTSFEMSGLNPGLNYCFAVVAVYRGNQFATSPQSCTARTAATPR